MSAGRLDDREAVVDNMVPDGGGETNGESEAGEVKTFDDILVHLGNFGRYQRRVYFFLFLPTIFSAMHKLAWVFLGAKVNHRCRLEEEVGMEDAKYTVSEEYEDRFEWNDAESRYEQCSYKVGNESRPCDHGWVYDRSTFGSSAVMDWDLVCDDQSYRATAQALFMLGVLIGSYVFGALSDRLGRKPTFVSAVVIQSIFGLACGLLPPNYWLFVSLRTVIGATTSGVFLVSYVLAMEMVGPRSRLVAGTLCQYYYTFGFFLMALIAYYLNDDWRMLQVVLTLPTLVFVTYWWFMPESVRWLIRKGRYDEAQGQIQRVAKVNCVVVSTTKIECMMSKPQEDENKSPGSFIDLFRTPNLRIKTLNLFFNWFVNSGTYYGLSLGASDLGGNPYLNFFLSAAVEIPAYMLNLMLLNRVGRRLVLAGFMLTGAVALMATVFVPAQAPAWVVITLSMIGKLAITASYGVVYIFSTEQFPTEVRNVGIGGCSMCARIGGILCPYINLLNDFWTPMPLIIYGVLAAVAGSLALLLPETLNKKLPETLADGEEFGKKNNAREDI